MRNRWFCLLVVCLGTLGPTASPWANEAVPTTAEELFQRAGDAYRTVDALELELTTSVEIPGAEPGERTVRYVLGSGRRAVIEIGSLLRIVVTDERVLAEHLGVPDRILEVFVEGDDLGAALATARGRSSMAGFWEPPQAALRAGGSVERVLEAFRYSRAVGELHVAGFERQPDSGYAVRLVADNGDCVASFDKRFRLTEVEYRLEPVEAPEGVTVRVRGRYSSSPFEGGTETFELERRDRRVVESIRELAAEPPGIGEAPETILSPEALAAALLAPDELAAALSDRRVLLIGEEHLTEEIPEYTTELLGKLDDRPAHLLLEMPLDAQPAIDAYLQTGDEAILHEIFDGKPILQLQHLLRWARERPRQVSSIEAFDQSLWEIVFRRAFLEDTRNVTMSRAILRAWKEHPERRVVAYAGQLHLLAGGRYRVDHPSRDPAGSRLSALGIPPEEIARVMINGGENFHLQSIWPRPGALPIAGGPARIPIPYLIDYPIFGVAYADEVFDYFVHVGALTPIEVNLQ